MDPPELVHELVQRLKSVSEGPSKQRKMRMVIYDFAPTGDKIASFGATFDGIFKRSDRPPTMARGLFISLDRDKVVVRGYDKFFNVGEIEATQWSTLAATTQAPYEMTVKENGCIVFVSSLDGHLVITSKHVLGQARREGEPYSHAQKGEHWLDQHLKRAGRTRSQLSDFLENNNVTAVFELTDDDFEEHVLSYGPDRTGLHVHGLNRNTIDFSTLPVEVVDGFANHFGFMRVGSVIKTSLDDVRSLVEECAKTGSYQGVPVEGFVIRCKTVDDKSMFFKVKFDEPYLMYREWREVTKQLIANKPVTLKLRFAETERYIEFVRTKLSEDPELFELFNQNKGIIRIRDMFLQHSTNQRGLH